jgi:ABC-2 type transport system permease protein
MSAAAPVWRSTVAQAAMELRLTWRRGENVLVTIVLPAVVLLFFSAVPMGGDEGGVSRLLPATISLALIATGLVNLGIATGYERSYGVLKRLGGTPLTRAGLVTAKMLGVLALEVIQIVLLVALGLALGWRAGDGWSPVLAVVGVLLGTAAFAGLGLAMAGRLRPEATMALANGLFLAFLLLGGVIVPLDQLPDAVAAVARLLPAAALTDVMTAALDGGGDVTQPLIVLGVWTAGAVAVATTTFRWD